MEERGKIETIADGIKNHLITSLELMKLEMIQSISRQGAALISYMPILLVAVFCLLFMSVGAGLYLAYLLTSTWAGFLVVGGFYFLLMCLLWAIRHKSIKIPIENQIISGFFTDKTQP